jgi:hypothetical protein
MKMFNNNSEGGDSTSDGTVEIGPGEYVGDIPLMNNLPMDCTVRVMKGYTPHTHALKVIIIIIIIIKTLMFACVLFFVYSCCVRV